MKQAVHIKQASDLRARRDISGTFLNGRHRFLYLLRDSMNYWGVGRTHVITQAVWGYDWSSMPENFMHKIEQKVEKTVSAIQKSAGNVTPCAKVYSLFARFCA